MKVVLFAGDHPRHRYVAAKLLESGLLHGMVVEKRSAFVPSPPPGLPEVDRINYIRHFRDREEAEHRFFGSIEPEVFDAIPILHTTAQDLNSETVQAWIGKQRPDVVLTYGVHVIKRELMEWLPDIRWNIHGGLSPWYRGNITLFWPFYFLQPNWAGITIHELTDKLDGGAIVHHAVPELKRGDGIHDVACRAVVQAVSDLIVILNAVRQGKRIISVPQKSTGKLFTASDWKPQHLRLIYNTFNNDIVDRYLDGEFGHREPPLVRAF